MMIPKPSNSTGHSRGPDTESNWLPINRKDEGIDVILRVYVPDMDKMKTWKAPKAVLVK